MNGTYSITIYTPIGPQQGSLSLHADDGTLTGTIRILGNQKAFRGTADENRFTFSSVFQNPMVRLAFTARGLVKDGILDAVAETNFGPMKMKGKRQ